MRRRQFNCNIYQQAVSSSNFPIDFIIIILNVLEHIAAIQCAKIAYFIKKIDCSGYYRMHNYLFIAVSKGKTPFLLFCASKIN